MHMYTSVRVIAMTVALSSVASAQPSQPTESAEAAKIPVARRLYEEGVDAVNKGRWSLAHDRFKASFDLAPRVLTLFNLAGAQAQLGRFVEATESYRRFLRETIDGRYPELRQDATTQLELLEQQLSQITIEVKHLDAADVIAIDQSEFPHTAVREPIPMNPGAHAVTISRMGSVIVTRPLSLTAGAAQNVKIELPRKVDLKVQQVPPSRPGDNGQFASSRESGDRKSRSGVLRSPWFWTAVAVVVAGGATGAYFLTRSDADLTVQ